VTTDANHRYASILMCYAYTRLGTVCTIKFTESWYTFPLVPEFIPSISVEGTPIAGQQYSLNCNITKIRSGLSNSFTVTAQWMDSNGQSVISTDGSIRETTTNTDQSTIHTITFSPLRTSHGGQYTCRGSAQSSLLVKATTVSITQNVTVTSKGYAMCVASL